MARINYDELAGDDRKKLKAAVDKAMRDQYGEGLEPDRAQASVDSILPIVPPDLWQPPAPPQINITVHKDHYIGGMLLVAFGLTMAPFAIIAFILASTVPGLLVAFAAGMAVAFGVRLSRSHHVNEHKG